MFCFNDCIFIRDFLCLQRFGDDLMSGRIHSNHMCLWKHPSTSLKLKQYLKPRMLHFSNQRVHGKIILLCVGVEI